MDENETNEANATIMRLRSMLAEVVERESGPCEYDHKGFCQSHFDYRPCVIARARAVLDGSGAATDLRLLAALADLSTAAKAVVDAESTRAALAAIPDLADALDRLTTSG